MTISNATAGRAANVSSSFAEESLHKSSRCHGLRRVLQDRQRVSYDPTNRAYVEPSSGRILQNEDQLQDHGSVFNFRTDPSPAWMGQQEVLPSPHKFFSYSQTLISPYLVATVSLAHGVILKIESPASCKFRSHQESTSDRALQCSF